MLKKSKQIYLKKTVLKKLPITAPKTKSLKLISPHCAINSAINEENICKIIQ